MELIERLLRTLLVLNFIVFFVFAVENRPPELVMSGVAVSAVGLIFLAILPPFLYRRRFYRTVEEYASSRMLSYSADERSLREVRFAMGAALGFAVLAAGVVLEIVTHHLAFLTISFFGVVSYGIVWGLKDRSRKRENLEDAALQLQLAYDFDEANQIPRLLGTFRGRETLVYLETVRSFSGGGVGASLSRGNGGIVGSSSRVRISEVTIIHVHANAPEGVSLSFQGGKRKSQPPELVSYLMGRAGVAGKVRAVAPFSTITLRPPRLSLRWEDAVTDPVELRFLLDLLCDIAESVEAFSSGNPDPNG